MKIKTIKSGIQMSSKETKIVLRFIDNKVDAEKVNVVVDTIGRGSEGVTNIISTPGEYEIDDVLVYYLIDKNGEDFQKSVYFEINGDGVAYLSNLASVVSERIVEKFGEISVLLVSVESGSIGYLLQSIRELEPKIVIPIGETESIEKFEEEIGVEKLSSERGYFSMKSNEINSIEDGPKVFTL